MRQFRVTGTTAEQILLACDPISELLGVSEETNSNTDEILLPQNLLNSLCGSWFSNARSTEVMKRGTANEGAVLHALGKKPYICDLFEVGMLAHKEHSWLACFPDALALVRVGADTESDAHGSTDSLCVSKAMATVEVKTRISKTIIQVGQLLATTDLVECTVGDETCARYIPREHVGQVVMQMVVTSIRHCVYCCATETEILYTVFMDLKQETAEQCLQALVQYGSVAVRWAHVMPSENPQFLSASFATSLKTKHQYWKSVNDFVMNRHAFPPLKLFKHGTQCLYSRTKGGIDGSAQARAILRSPTSSLKWEQKVVTQTMKTLAVNAFISWRMLEKGAFWRLLKHSRVWRTTVTISIVFNI